jgi:tRNA(Ile)-lysidine synthase
MDLLTLAETCVREHSLLSAGDRVLVALSGGPDSVALLHVLSRLRRKFRLTPGAVYINHGIRPEAARKEEQLCRKLCDRLECPLEIVREDIPALSRRLKKGVEETARDFRYETFERMADERGFSRIAVGHHADDRVETILFRILRGTGRTGLEGMPVRRGKIIRPLFAVAKDEILAYCRKHRLKYAVDATNATVEYSRNYLRNRLLPEIRKNLNPSVDRALLNLSENLGIEEAFLANLTRKALRRVLKMTPGGKIQLDLTRLGRYDRAIRRRVLRHCLQTLSDNGLAPDKEVIDRLEALVAGAGTAVSIPGGIETRRLVDQLVIRRRDRRHFDCDLPVSRRVVLNWPAITFRASVQARESDEPRTSRGARSVSLDADRVKLPLRVRNIRPGDRFRPLGLGGTKKVGDFLTDRKVPAVYRDEIPVVCDKEGILWLVGYEIADRVKVTARTKEVLRVDAVFARKRHAAAV